MSQKDLLERADRVLPGGVLGGHRSGPGLEFVVKDARGPYLWDSDGKRYLDYLLGSGPMLLGHAHPAVVEAVQRQAGHGTTFMLLNEPIIELAEEIVRAVPCADQVRFMSAWVVRLLNETLHPSGWSLGRLGAPTVTAENGFEWRFGSTRELRCAQRLRLAGHGDSASRREFGRGEGGGHQSTHRRRYANQVRDQAAHRNRPKRWASRGAGNAEPGRSSRPPHRPQPSHRGRTATR